VGNARDVAATPALRLLPFLFRHHLAPAAPAAPTATRTGQSVTLIWRNGTERDLAGYEVLRTTADGATTRVGPALVGRTTFVDTSAPPGAVYTLRAIDTSGNRSGPSTGAPT
jgi:hypothetical protein